MSECVVRMEMPNGCHDCKLRNMIGNCPIPMFDGLDEKKIWTLEECFKRPPWCPILCSLPEGHGRLVDAEEMYKKSEAFCNQCRQGEHDCEKCNYIVAQGYMYKSPTIVPAEAERSETHEQ